MINKIKDKLKQAFTTKIGLGVTAIVWIILWAIVYKITDAEWTYNMAVPGILFLIGGGLIWIAFGVIINPIRRFINKRKNKK